MALHRRRHPRRTALVRGFDTQHTERRPPMTAAILLATAIVATIALLSFAAWLDA